MPDRDIRRARWQRDRDREADRIEADIEHLDRNRKRMAATARRLRGELNVDALVALAEQGTGELTQAELAVVAAERPDAFNDVFERSMR
jgi:hypothetical protein